jgi:hypothetical protein
MAIGPKQVSYVWLKLRYIFECYSNGDESYKDYPGTVVEEQELVDWCH